MLEMEEEGMEGGGGKRMERGGRSGGEEGVERRKEWRGGRSGGEEGVEGRKRWRGGRDGGEQKIEESVKGAATLTSTVYTPILPGCQRRYGS